MTYLLVRLFSMSVSSTKVDSSSVWGGESGRVLDMGRRRMKTRLGLDGIFTTVSKYKYVTMLNNN